MVNEAGHGCYSGGVFQSTVCRREPALAGPVNKALLDVQAAKLLQQELDAQPVGNGAETAWAWEAPERGDLPTSTWD